MTEDRKGFLSRWSRLKREGAPDVDAAEHESRGEPTAEEAQAEAEAVTAAELPDVDSLDKDSDYSAFLREGVPEHLKRQALRKLWRSDPVFANLDGLNDYDEDFAALYKAASQAVRTAYRVGRGWLGDDDEAEDEAGQRKAGAPKGQTSPSVAADGGRAEEGQDEGDDGTGGAATPDERA